MFISDFAIKRPLITVVAMVALVVFGIFSLLKLKTDEFPDVAPPWLTIGVIYPGAAPEGVEKEVLDPIEEQVASIAGVKRIMSKAYDGYAMLMVEFLFDKDLNEASQDVRDAISAIRADLPSELEEPIIRKFNNTDTPIISLALSSVTLDRGRLTQIADPGITRELRSIAGVSDVSIFGKVERELTVNLRPERLQASNVSVGQVVQAIQLQNLATPVGRVTGQDIERSIRLKGRFESAAEFGNLVVTERGGRLIRLRDVADVVDGGEESRTLALYNSADAIGIDIKKMKGYSTTDVANRVRAKLGSIDSTLRAEHPGAKLEIVKDAGVRVDANVKNVIEALVEGAALTVLVVFLFLNSWRSTVITGVALPISVMASFIAVYLLDFKLETMSLLGLSLAIGILIDDAIVVRENIVRHVEMGKDHFRAAHEGTDEIGLAVAATTFSILAVFVPIGFMTGESGQWFKPFALTIACSVAVSLFVSFSLDPMLSAYWPDPHKEPHERMWLTRLLDRFNAWFNRQAQNYKRVIAWALDHRTGMMVLAAGTFFASFLLPTQGISGLLLALASLTIAVFGMTKAGLSVAVRALTVVAGIGGFFFVFAAPSVIGKPLVEPWRTVGGGLFPEEDRGELIMKLETPPGSNLEYTKGKALEVTGVINRHRDVVEAVYSTIGGGMSGTVDEASLYVKLLPRKDRTTNATELAAMLRQEVKSISGAAVAVWTSDWGGFKQIQIQIRGNEIGVLNKKADELFAEVKKIPGAVDVGISSKGQKPELEVELKRGVAGAMGVSVGQVAQSLRPAFAGIDAGDWVDPTGETRDVMVRLVPEARRNADNLARLPIVVAGPTGVPSTVSLGDVATIRNGYGPAIIDHLNRQLVVNVELNVAGRSATDVQNEIKALIDRTEFPPGVVKPTLGGDAESQEQIFGSIFSALGLAVLLMYLILVVQFGSFVDPIAIMLSLPLSLIGVLLALAIAGHTINIMSMIGVILLMGIVAKNAILLVDFAKWAREDRGLSLRESLIEAGAIRLRPILMTTFALIAGMVPVALGNGEGAQFRAPLGVAVIGGVVTSTFLTLLVIPTGYEILDEIRRWFGRKFGFKPKQMTAEHPVPVAGD
jgi:HAE1 family hydrophobic/amphiphilic exporter-1